MKPYRDDENRIIKNHILVGLFFTNIISFLFFFVFFFLRHKLLNPAF